MRVLQSTLRAPAPVVWPRYRAGQVVYEQIPAHRIPPGWQSVQITVPMRVATCEETDCRNFLQGWTEVLMADGNVHAREGQVTRDEAAQTYGRFGPASLPPEVVFRPAGTPCPDIHKVPSGRPPAYVINGRLVPWTEFEDAVSGGLERARQLQKEGRY